MIEEYTLRCGHYMTNRKEKDMAIRHYKLLAGEKIVMQENGVSHGGNSFSDEIILTDRRIIWVNYGLLGVHKGTEYYPLSQVREAVPGKSKNGKLQLEIHMTDKIEAFCFKSGGNKKVSDWAEAVSKQIGAYNKQSKNEKKDQIAKSVGIIKTVLKPIVENPKVVQAAGEFVGDVAKSVLQQGELTAIGIKQGIADASKKQIRKTPVGAAVNKIKDDLGLNEKAVSAAGDTVTGGEPDAADKVPAADGVATAETVAGSEPDAADKVPAADGVATAETVAGGEPDAADKVPTADDAAAEETVAGGEPDAADKVPSVDDAVIKETVAGGEPDAAIEDGQDL